MRSLGLASGYVSEEFRIFERFLESIVCDVDINIYQQGGRADCFYYLKTGLVRSFIKFDDGREKRLRVYDSGNIFGFSSFIFETPHYATVTTLSKSEIFAIDQLCLQRCIGENASLMLSLMEAQAAEMKTLTYHAVNRALLPIEKRTADFFLGVVGAGRTIRRVDQLVYKVTQDTLAKILGVSRITVTRVLRQLSDAGILKTGYGEIIICDMAALSELSGEAKLLW